MIFLFIIALATMVYPAQAQLVFNPDAYPIGEPIQEYFAAKNQHYTKSIIYVFFNNNDVCFNCPQTIELTEQVYNEYYTDKYSMYVINYQDDNEYDFAYAYKLNSPLAIVLVKIHDGEVWGYQKISNPQYMIQEGADFITYLRKRIDQYLGQPY